MESPSSDQDLPTTPNSQPSPASDSATLALTVLHQTKPHTFSFPQDATLSDLLARLSSTLSIPPDAQKLLISPRPGLLKAPFPCPPLLLSTFTSSKIQLLTPSTSLSRPTAAPNPNRTALKPATPSRAAPNVQTLQSQSSDAFGTLVPLPHLPNPERSRRYLARLAADAGIQAAMRKHRFRVGVLTEMDPAEHTTHESRTLGLNRNAGEVIELRLRTDAYDGYRDYRTIRKTLCHELAHNVFGEHNRRFWDLCHEIEREVERGDWRAGGRSVGNEEFYAPGGEEGVGEVDGGGWTGGSQKLGGGAGAGWVGESVRERAARAAEERERRTRDGGGSRGEGS